jgi:hypothetical protein
MWFPKSAKDQILGVDTLGQRVPPHVRYGTSFLLIRHTICCVSCSEEWEVAWCFHPAHMVQEGPVGETLALQVGPLGEIIAKYDILL